MFCLMKCSKKVLAAVAALLCCGGMLAAIWQTKEVLGSAYEDLYPDMYVNTGSEFAKEEGKVVYYTFDELAEIYDGYYDDYEEESSSQSQPETDTSSSRPSTVVNLPAQVPAPTPTPSSSEESSQEEPEEEESSQPEESSSQESSSSYEGFHVQADPEEPADKGGLSAGAVVAIIIGALVLAGGVVALGIYLYKRSNESYYD